MEDKFTKREIILFVTAILGIVFFLIFHRELLPNAGIKLHLSNDQIEDKATAFVNDLGYDISGYTTKINFRQDENQIKYLTHQYDMQTANTLMQNKLPAYYWSISWDKPKGLFDEFKESEDNEQKTVTVEAGDDVKFKNDLKVTLTTWGEILSFETKLNPKMKADILGQEEAFQLAQQLVEKSEGDSTVHYRFQQVSGDSVRTYKWNRDSLLLGEQIAIEVQIKGSHIVGYNKNYSPPQEILNIPDQTKFFYIPGIIIFLLFFITILIVLIQRLRRDEVGIKNGLGLSIVVGLAFIINFLSSSYQESFLEILIPLLLAPTFLMLALLAIISASESLSREVWREKVRSFDALNKLKIVNPLFGKSILSGTTLAFMALGITTLFLKLVSYTHGHYFTIEESDISHYVIAVPIIYLILSTLSGTSFAEFAFRVFSITFLRKFLNREIFIIVISSLLWAFNFAGANKIIILPVYLQILENFIIGVLFAFFFIKYDIMTVIFGSMIYNMMDQLYPMFFWGDAFILWNGVAGFIFIGALFIIGIIGYNRKFDEKQLSQFIPPYVVRMQERERMKRELEIARKVQLSFLPKEIPQFPKLNIATVCIPATEVGGDYYDFIRLGDNKLGVVIGDVSGKGISAAFHMTLTKGFLKSQAKDALSPRNVLVRLNELFYENVERGTFISMIYGIFDIDNKTFTFARAGHNPVLIRSSAFSNIEDLCPKGIALGLESGPVFNKIIEEQKVGIRSGDIFVFYTDGVSEAMNSERAEFGEQRLQTILETHYHVFADDLVKIVQQRINDFVGKTPQHDDLTMIIIKIL